MADSGSDERFLTRWSRLKAQARPERQPSDSPSPDNVPAATPSPEAALPGPAPQMAPATAGAAASPTAGPGATTDRNESAPTMADVAQLTPQSDFTRFVAGDVQTDVKNAALKKLFSDPHFNLMDGLDVYIDDYNISDPVPPSMLRKMAQARFLGLLTDLANEEDAPPIAPSESAATGAAPPCADPDPPPVDRIASHEDADLQLQPHDDAGRCDAQANPGGDAGREH